LANKAENKIIHNKISRGRLFMKSQLQKLIQKVFSDEKTRAAFVANPAGVISEFKLSRTEKDALLKTHSRFGLVTSDSLHLDAAIDQETDWT
jgi:hypothetical protein